MRLLRGFMQAASDSAAVSTGSIHALGKTPLAQPPRRSRAEFKQLVAEYQVSTCGVVQPKVTVTYRFDKTNELERLAPQEAYLRSPIRIPAKPETVGDHLRVQRLSQKLLQKEVAEQVGVDKTTIANWEANATQPGFEYMPAIIRFLGYNPLRAAKNGTERLVLGRTALGLSQTEAANRIGVHPSTVARWERGEREPTGANVTRAERLLSRTEDVPTQARRAG